MFAVKFYGTELWLSLNRLPCLSFAFRNAFLHNILIINFYHQLFSSTGLTGKFRAHLLQSKFSDCIILQYATALMGCAFSGPFVTGCVSLASASYLVSVGVTIYQYHRAIENCD